MVRKLILVAVAAALCLGMVPGLVSAAKPKFSAGSPGIGDPYFPLDGNGGYNVQRYRLKVTYDPATDRLTGEATIVARATQDLSAFNLDFVGLKLRSVRVNGTKATTKRKGAELTVRPKRGLTEGTTFTVVARYDGVPTTLEEFGLSGFIHTDDGAIVIGEPHVAATWFPVNDHPRDKAKFSFEITVPAGVEAISNGVLKSQRTRGGWSTWKWDAAEPMSPYLAMMAIGQFDVRAYQTDGIKYWDAIDSALMADRVPAITPEVGAQFLYSQVGEPAYKRLTHSIDVPASGAQLSFQVNRDTEPGWDFVFVETRTVGGDDWTTLPDANGHTTQDVGACPGFLDFNPFLAHYLTPVMVPGDPSTPDDDFVSCDPTGTTGAWHAASGLGDGWETWLIQIPSTGAPAVPTEVSITYASDGAVQGRGVVLDDVVVSTGQGSTSFESDGNTHDGWIAPIAGPDGSADNPNTWATSTFIPAVPGLGLSALVSFDRQPEILAFQADDFGPYPFAASGGIVDEVGVGFALENQTRPTYSPFFFGGPEGNDFVVVHELAHQWFGDSLAVHAWQHIWLNEGFATYAEWLWSEAEGFGSAQQIFDSFAEIPADDFFWELAIGDPGPDALFAFPVYARGAMTLQALRQEIGDARFFDLLEAWATTQADGTVTTREFIRLAERISGQDLDALFDVWLSSGKPNIGSAALSRRSAALSVNDLPAAARSLVERLHDREGQPFKDATGKSH